MSSYNREGLQQFTNDKAKESKESKIEKDANKFSASEFGERTTRYNANEMKPNLKNDVDESKKHKHHTEDKQVLTNKEMDEQDKANDLEEAYLNNKAGKPIEGLRIFDDEDKKEMKRLYHQDKKFLSIASMGVSIENGHGLYRGGFNRINFINTKLGAIVPNPK